MFVILQDGSPLNPGTGENDRVRQMPNGNLYISPVYTSDQGVYECRATNNQGEDRSHGNLTVLGIYTVVLILVEHWNIL